MDTMSVKVGVAAKSYTPGPRRIPISVSPLRHADGVDLYEVSWNHKHIVNEHKREHINSVCRNAGLQPTIICTPAQLMEDIQVKETPKKHPEFDPTYTVSFAKFDLAWLMSAMIRQNTRRQKNLRMMSNNQRNFRSRYFYNAQKLLKI